MDFILTIDTEADNQWDHGCGLTVENIRFIPRFQKLCEKYHVKPTYLVTSEVCDDAYARALFLDYNKGGGAEIGAHLHSWTTPPFQEKSGFRFNDINHAFATELPVEILDQKIKYLTSQIESSFGKRPYSFRSGRYGFNETVAKVLFDNSYLVDTSVTPFSSWASHKGIPGGTGGADFIEKTSFPYEYLFPAGSLIEIPITILPTRFPLKQENVLSRYYFRNVNRNFPLRVLRKLLFERQPIWLRPFEWMTATLLEELFMEAEHIKLPYIVMMLHSSELMAGCSIYRKDEGDINKLYRLLESFFILLKGNNIGSVTLSDAAIEIKASQRWAV
jgi:hypothetical protein